MIRPLCSAGNTRSMHLSGAYQISATSTYSASDSAHCQKTSGIAAR